MLVDTKKIKEFLYYSITVYNNQITSKRGQKRNKNIVQGLQMAIDIISNMEFDEAWKIADEQEKQKTKDILP